VRWGRVVAAAALLGGGFLAWQGGSHSLSDYRELQNREITIRARMDSLAHAADSMRAYRDSLLSDAGVQERVVREVLGMVRPGELSVIIARERRE
jgi:cell division protein FtsB